MLKTTGLTHLIIAVALLSAAQASSQEHLGSQTCQTDADCKKYMEFDICKEI